MAVHTKTIDVGATIPARRLQTLTGEPVTIPQADRLVHLQFRRFAGCPVCNLHLRSFVRRHDEIESAGLREVVLFHSTADDLRRYESDLPFTVVADPDKRIYREFGVESSPRALLHPRAWWPIVRAVGHSLVAIVRDRQAPPPLTPHGGRYGLPTDILVGPDGRVVARHDGTHVDDQWSVDEVLALARTRRPDAVNS
ncbi:MAG: AhpC/TSA family protein [Acidimicrobiales bacterium]|nr:AhpC/TSA family protein [Acidimicrobiales bacterium]